MNNMDQFDFRNIYFWVHTSFSAVSIAFFLSLLSAQPEILNALSIKISSVLFCFSVVLNAGLSIFLALFGSISDYVNRIYVTFFPWNHPSSLPALSIFSFVLGVIALLAYYSYLYAFIAVLTIFYTANRIQSLINEVNAAAYEGVRKTEQ